MKRPTTYVPVLFLSLTVCAYSSVSAAEHHGDSQTRAIGSLDWHTEYETAYEEAKAERQMLFLFFRDEAESNAADHYETSVLADPALEEQLGSMVRAVVPLSEPVPEASEDASDGDRRLIDHNAFRQLDRRQGIVLIDFRDPAASYYGRVVSAHPFTRVRYYTVHSTQTVLDLPPGTISQRAMIYTIRMHPERPRSVNARADAYLLAQAERHSEYMARVGQVGHQHWDSRFQQITAAMGGRGVSEVAAVGSGRTILDGARDCLDAWRQSSGHWSGVNGNCSCFGYDIRQGRDGQWYATGLFAYPD